MVNDNRNTITVVGDKNSLKAMLTDETMVDSLKAVASKYMTPEKIAKIALLAAGRQPKIFSCTKASVITSIIAASEMGLDFSGQSDEGYLVPYGKECKFIPGYQGFIELMYRSEEVTYVDAQLVYEKDEYDYDLGSAPFIKHKPSMVKNRGEVVFAYMVVKLRGSEYPKIEIMSLAQLMAIKNLSPAKGNGPWVNHPAEMMRKTVIRRGYKYVPKTAALIAAIAADDQQYDYSDNVAEEFAASGTASLKEKLAEKDTKKVKSKTSDAEPKKPQESAEEPKSENEGDSTDGTMNFDAYQCLGCKKKNIELNENGLCPHCLSDKVVKI